uniref:Uncharacterized protein n=1 Tax=Lepisosteus oculatus TaxID=7918 RepID=W5MIP1_LEPOC
MITTAVLLCVLICSGLRCVRSESLAEAGLLACELVEERVSSGLSGAPETQFVNRKAALLLARPGREADTAQRLQEAQRAGVVTFLATGSAVDVTRHVPGGTEQLQCEIRRYSTGGIQVPWKGTAGPDSAWFTCTLRHSANEFIVTAFLLYPSPAPQQPIGDADTLNTSGGALAADPG